MKRFALVVVSFALVACGQRPDVGVDLAPVAPSLVVEEPRLPDELPDDLLLPHEYEGRRSGSGGRVYEGVCLDPPPDLQDALPDDGRAIWFEDGMHVTIERIALFLDESVAAEAMSDLRRELELCGDGVDHVGNPHAFVTLPQPDLPHAHETLQWHTTSFEGPEAFVTVARLGRVVYLVDHRTDADLDRESVLWHAVIRAEKAVGSFALELCSHGFGRGCQEDPS